jgi:hypothetical protein
MTIFSQRGVVRFLQCVRELQPTAVDFAWPDTNAGAKSLIEQRSNDGMRVAPSVLMFGRWASD